MLRYRILFAMIALLSFQKGVFGQSFLNGVLNRFRSDSPKNWVRLETLGWFHSDRNTVPLLTTSPAGTAQIDAGVLGRPGTQILVGEKQLNDDSLRFGGRITVGHWFGEDGEISAMVRMYGLENGTLLDHRKSDGTPILARPFFNSTLDVNDSVLVAYPGLTSNGSIHIRDRLSFLGGDAMFRLRLNPESEIRLDWLAGYQVNRIDDSLVIRNYQTSVGQAGVPNGTIIGVTDRFLAQNEFHGATIGLMGETWIGDLSIDGLIKVAFGNVRESVAISGATINSLNGVSSSTLGGLYTQSTNIGLYERNRFSFVPEANVNMTYKLTDAITVVGGYTFLYFTRVAMAADQIDPRINLTQRTGPIVGARSPAFRFNEGNFWVQGVSLGIELRF